jgi:thioredoxin 1
MIAPILEEIAVEYRDRLTVGKINGDEHTDLVTRYDVMGFPTMNLSRDGEVVELADHL